MNRERTIDQLAIESGVPSRTIRFYQSNGALQRPTMRGRVAYYDDEHAERLKLIASLQERGLRIRGIRDLLKEAEKGARTVDEWLGLGKQLQEPWVPIEPQLLTESELHAQLGRLRPGYLEELIRLKQVERRGDRYLIPNLRLFALGIKLETAGIDVATSVGAVEILRKHLGRAASELTRHFFRKSGEGFGKSFSVPDLGSAYLAVRTGGLDAVREVFAEEIERAVRKLVARNNPSDLDARARRRTPPAFSATRGTKRGRRRAPATRA